MNIKFIRHNLGPSYIYETSEVIRLKKVVLGEVLCFITKIANRQSYYKLLVAGGSEREILFGISKGYSFICFFISVLKAIDNLVI